MVVGVTVSPSPLGLYRRNGQMKVCDRAQTRFIEISSECFRLHFDYNGRDVTYFSSHSRTRNVQTHKYFNQTIEPSSEWHSSEIIKPNQTRAYLYGLGIYQEHVKFTHSFDHSIIALDSSRFSFLCLLLLLLLPTRFCWLSPIPLHLMPWHNFNSK